MDLLDKKTDNDLIKSALAEIAKAKSEVSTAEADVRKVKNRLSFLIVLVNEMIKRQEK